MTGLVPRAVLVTRPTEMDELLAVHATRGQAEFFLTQRGLSIVELERRHEAQMSAVEGVKRSLPGNWVVADARRDDLDRFLFTERDIVIAIGQDGLVANLAKYLKGQPVVGVTPSQDATEGVLTATPVDVLRGLLPKVVRKDAVLQRRTMVQALLDDGRRLTALNELFIGHRSHQSARYLIRAGDTEEFQSSSGVIVSTGTGLTGWARSILTATGRKQSFPPEAKRAAFFAREPWPSKTTGSAMAYGEIEPDRSVSIVSQMNDGGVIFADGVEQDYLRFEWGKQVKIELSGRTLNLVQAA